MSDRTQQAFRRRRELFLGNSAQAELINQDQGRVQIPERATNERPSLTGQPISEAEKLVEIEKHIEAFASTLPMGALSDAEKMDIRSKAMLGGSSPSAIMISVLQAAMNRPGFSGGWLV